MKIDPQIKTLLQK